MVARAEALADTLPDSTIHLIDSVLRMPVYFSERQRMDMALLQGEALFGNAPLDDDLFEDTAYRVATSPELERAADYYAKKKRYAKAAHAALYSGYVQQHYNEKEPAMRSYKAAEQYGLLSNDSLTVARAEYRMGKMLYYEGREEGSLNSFVISDGFIGNRYTDRATIENSKAVIYILRSRYDSAEICLRRSLLYSQTGNSERLKRKIYNNYSMLYCMQSEYDKAIAYLGKMAEETCLDVADSIFLFLNMGKVYMVEQETDSAAVYFALLDILLPNAEVREETKVSAYGALANFSEQRGNVSKALQYRELREEYLSEIMKKRQEQAIYRIQQQYDFETMRNDMSQKIIHRQRIITVLSMMVAIALMVLAYFQIRLAKMRKQEAEANANLFHFMQQNKKLVQKSEEQELAQIYLTQKQKETAAEYGERLSFALKKEQSVMLRLHLFLQNMGDEELLKKLEKTVFGKKTHWDAMMETVDRLYPQLREIVKQENLGLDENEQKDVILSYFNVSRQDEALLLDKTTDMVDKIRNRSRKKIQAASKENTLPDIK